MKKRFSAHHRTTAKVRPGHETVYVRTATRKREKVMYTAHAPVTASPRPCALQLFAFGQKYLGAIILK